MSETFLKRADGSKIRYEVILGTRKECIVFLHGLLSSHKSVKAACVRDFAVQNGFSFLALDYTAHGESSGRPQDFRIGQCFKDTLDVINAALFDDNPLVLVGSSLGGWIALLVARFFKQRVVGVVGLAAAPDFTVRVWNDIFKEQERAFLKAGGILGPSPETKGYCFSYDMFQEAEQHLLLNGPILYQGPVILVQGDKDLSVPADIPFCIKEALDSECVMIYVIKGADHALARPSDLRQIHLALQAICAFGER